MSTVANPIYVRCHDKQVLWVKQQEILETVRAGNRDGVIFKQAVDKLINQAHLQGFQLPYCCIQKLKILIYPNQEGKQESRYFCVINLAWRELDQEQLEALKTLTPILKSTHQPWPLWVKQRDRNCGCLAMHANQLMEGEERFLLDQSVTDETGQQVLMGKKLALDWLKEWNKEWQTSVAEDNKAVIKENLISLFSTFKSVKQGTISFTEQEWAPFRNILGEQVYTLILIKMLEINKVIPIEQKFFNGSSKTSSTLPSASSMPTSISASPVLTSTSGNGKKE